MIPEGNPKLFGKITCQWYFEKEGCQPKRAGLQPAGRSRPALQEQVVKHSLLNYSTGRRHRVGLPLCTKVCKDQGREQPIHCTKASQPLWSEPSPSALHYHPESNRRESPGQQKRLAKPQQPILYLEPKWLRYLPSSCEIEQHWQVACPWTTGSTSPGMPPATDEPGSGQQSPSFFRVSSGFEPSEISARSP